MKYILLDTCVLVNCTLINATDSDPELLATIVDRMRDQGIKLLVPEVVKLEYERKVPEELQRIRQQTKKFRESVTTSVLQSTDVSTIHEVLDKIDSDRDAAADRAQAYFFEAVADPEVTVPIALDGDTLAEAVGYVLAGKKPSHGPRNGLIDPDSLIVACMARFARLNNLTDSDTILICSDNHKDFAQWNQESNTRMLADSITDVMSCQARYYKNPRLLLEQELDVVVDTNESLRNALDNYDRITDALAPAANSIASDYIEQMKRFATSSIASDYAEQMKRFADSINSDHIEQMRRFANSINWDHVEQMKHFADSIDSSSLENMRHIGDSIDPKLAYRSYEIADGTSENDVDSGKSTEQESERETIDSSDTKDSDGENSSHEEVDEN